MADGGLNGDVADPPGMRLGTDLVAYHDGHMIYAKFNRSAFDAMRRRDLLIAFNRYCAPPRIHFRRPTPRTLVKRANKFLKRHDLPPVEALTFLEISIIQEGGDAPAGYLLAKTDVNYWLLRNVVRFTSRIFD